MLTDSRADSHLFCRRHTARDEHFTARATGRTAERLSDLGEQSIARKKGSSSRKNEEFQEKAEWIMGSYCPRLW